MIKRTFFVVILYCCGFLVHAQNQLSSLVNTQLGNKGKGARKEESYLEAGYTFPGATYPFGMVQFTPTYFHPRKGFVVNQMSGAGCEHMGNFPTLPLSGELNSSPGDMMNLPSELNIKESSAGYFHALSNGVDCQLTVTPRTGMAKYEYPSNAGVATILVGSGINETYIKDAFIKITGNGCEGYADGGQFCGTPVGYKVYFVAEFDRPFKQYGVWKNEKLIKRNDTVSGPLSGAWFEFDVSKQKNIQYKFAISYVSIENAKLNLLKENAQWNFEKLKHKAVSTWNDHLGRIRVSGGTKDHTIQFYSHLYHSLLHPNICNDVNGEYVASNGNIKKLAKGNYYTGFSNWDTYRSQVQLISMLFPAETSDMVNSIVSFAQDSGGGFPRWVLANTETGIMQGDPTSALVANAYAFGARSFDTHAALEVMRRSAEVPGTRSQNIETRPYLKQYLEKGYLNASMQLEYNSADFAIGRFALDAFGDQSLYEQYLQRSQSWKNLYNPSTTWLQSRNEDGSWKHYKEDWREASYKNYFWMVPHNLPALIDTIGGKPAAERRLDSFFTKINASYDQEWFAAGNEPDFQAPWIYNWVGKPSKTQALVKRIINEQYSNRPQGLPGNDDMGAMGAWYVFANIGIYPVVPGVGGFSLNSPSFSKIKISLPKGNLIITTKNAGQPLIKSMKLDGKKYSSTWLPLDLIKNGGRVKYVLSANPDQHWAEGDDPPGFDIK